MILLVVPLYFVIIWISIVMHELGHAVAEVLPGFQLETFVAGPFKIETMHECWVEEFAARSRRSLHRAAPKS
jgi:hypothetical protein